MILPIVINSILKLVSCLDIHHAVWKVIPCIHHPLWKEILSQVLSFIQWLLEKLETVTPGLHIVWHLEEVFWFHFNQSIHDLKDLYQVTSESPDL